MPVKLEDEPVLDVDEIQGHSLRGFDTTYLDLVGLKFEDSSLMRTWLRDLSGCISSLGHVHDYRLRRTSNDPATATEVLVNIAVSKFCLDALGFDTSLIDDGLFKKPMGRLAGVLGDRVVSGDLPDYVVGKERADTPDVMLLIGSQNDAALTKRRAELEASAAQHSARKIYGERGNVLPGEIEHFGFRDGISAPGPRGLLKRTPPTPLTLRYLDPSEPVADLFGKPGQPLVWPGQFVFGYPTQAEDPREPADPRNGPDWMKNGSFVVFRRLRQDVKAFREFLAKTATDLTTAGHAISAVEVGAVVVGRWQDGTPRTVSPKPDDAIASDPMHVNHFAYGGIGAVRVLNDDGTTRSVGGHSPDVDGSRCPHFAHVRKVNPRDQSTNKGGGALTLSFQMLRRGIPFGPLYADEPEKERGLMFLAYQTSFDTQFKELNSDWMNNSAAPELGSDGFDLLVGQNPAGDVRSATFHDGGTGSDTAISTTERFVIATGGAFLFSPAIALFRNL